jgi:ribosomal protein L9
MNRRAILTGSSIALSSLVAGCGFRTESVGTGDDTAEQDQDDEQESTEDEESSTDTGEETEIEELRDTFIVLRNVTPTDHWGSLTISTDTEILLKQNFEIDREEQQSIDSEITETGQYELSVSAEAGTETSFPFSIDEYDLREGSEPIVEINEDGIMILMQE